MRILLVHQNFPGQFKHLAQALAADPANEVVAFAMNNYEGGPRIRAVHYQPARGTSQSTHRWVVDLEAKVIRGEAAFHAALQLREQGFIPDVIIAHPGWGESLFLKDVWPSARMGIYCEFFYSASGADIGFDPEFPTPVEDACRVRVKNMNYLSHFPVANAGIAPTEWQRSVFPEPFRSRISVIHDGIDTDLLAPDPNVTLGLNNSIKLSRDDEIITFVNRNLEPYRGYHSFMRALPAILRARPNARVLIVGGDQVSYGAPPKEGGSWKEKYLAEVAGQIDRSRVHFIGKIPYRQFVSLLQISTVHIYLTYPFVLSWSLLEAMSCGCAIVASNTAPLREAIHHGETGLLVDFLDTDQLAAETIRLLDDPEQRERLGRAARAYAISHYDLKQVCLPRQLAWVKALAAQAPAL
ncbi:glycosyltransferase family 4 protein [Pseudoduganella sp. GCM10020061]|uniref:glycosyltransferase family 4 protein n=1 Tax=Pseudoduganella sp. GCM10020061 TaxID=3317345 RepID=UPI0036324370